MNEWWSWFKEIPISVKVKYIIALPIGIILWAIYNAGQFAETLSGIIGDWVRKDIGR